MQSLLPLISDKQGQISREFLATSPTAWATQQFQQRYGHSKLQDDDPHSFASRCFEALKDERRIIGNWFDDSGKFSPMLQSAFLSNKFHGPIGDGIGWDFRSDGSPEPRMLMFKGSLLSVSRTARLIPVSDRNRGNMQMAGLATLIRSAYTERAALHTWRGIEDINGAELSRRWIAHMTFTFLVLLQVDREWAWDASKCRKIFGPIDEKPSSAQ